MALLDNSQGARWHHDTFSHLSYQFLRFSFVPPWLCQSLIVRLTNEAYLYAQPSDCLHIGLLGLCLSAYD
jgi:hypothetical protein